MKTIASLQAVPSPSLAHFDFPPFLRPATQPTSACAYVPASVPLISKAGIADRLFNFCLDPININSVFVMSGVQFIGNKATVYI